ncbi:MULTISPECIES: zf-HC2 domain-containing protein [Streptomyces]|uniref:Putative zinc-finger domain-containing protein n=1 Tax=Streptomyces luteosporeus TaxID=173856 RepID=A0ABP6GNH5_9ACTN
MTTSGGQSPAEHHLGDRLAALVDGELGHESRERVLAHLATCWKCKAEADAQRRLKNVFAQSAPPPLSDSLLARLQSLPVADLGREDGDGPSGPPGGVAVLPLDRGFRIHPVRSPDAHCEAADAAAVRAASRGRRFAFAAAGAVSLAAIALAGAQPLQTAVAPPQSRGSGSGTAANTLAVTPGYAGNERDLARRAGSERPQPARSVSLLRTSPAPALPPLARAGLAGPTATAP